MTKLVQLTMVIDMVKTCGVACDNDDDEDIERGEGGGD